MSRFWRILGGLSLARDTYLRPRRYEDAPGFEADAQALASDWQAVGADMRAALKHERAHTTSTRVERRK